MAKTPQSVQKLLQSGGALKTDPDRDVMCQAFYDAVKDTCGPRSLGDNRSFNDYFSKHLRNQGSRGQAIASNIQREVPFIMRQGAGGISCLGQASAVASSGSGLAQQLAQRMLTASAGAARGLGASATLTAAGAVSGVGNAMLQAMYTGWSRFGQQHFRHFFRGTRPIFYGRRVFPVFQDGVYKGKVFEIKGPGDRMSARQAADAKRCSGGNEPYVVGCKSCGVNCSGGCPKTLTGPS